MFFQPESDTDLAELLEAGIPLIQGLSEVNNYNINKIIDIRKKYYKKSTFYL